MTTPINCPECGSARVGSVERVLVLANIVGINDDGSFEYEGESEVCWDTQEPTSLDPDDDRPTLECRECGAVWPFTPPTKES